MGVLWSALGEKYIFEKRTQTKSVFVVAMARALFRLRQGLHPIEKVCGTARFFLSLLPTLKVLSQEDRDSEYIGQVVVAPQLLWSPCAVQLEPVPLPANNI